MTWMTTINKQQTSISISCLLQCQATQPMKYSRPSRNLAVCCVGGSNREANFTWQQTSGKFAYGYSMPRKKWPKTYPKWWWKIVIYYGTKNLWNLKFDRTQVVRLMVQKSCTSWYGKYPIIHKGFIHPRWCGISSINSRKHPANLTNGDCSKADALAKKNIVPFHVWRHFGYPFIKFQGGTL